MTRNLRTTIKTTLSITQYHNQTSKSKKLTKNGFKKSHVNTKFRSLTEIFFTPQFLALSKTAKWLKNHFLSTPFFNFLQHPNQCKIFHAFHFLLQNSLKLKWLKKGLLQYSSSSRKKTAPQYNSNSLSCKKTAPQYNSNSLNCKEEAASCTLLARKWQKKLKYRG